MMSFTKKMIFLGTFSAPSMFDPRQLRAIPHNAILQQFGSPANIFYGVGRAAAIDPEKFITHFQNSARAKSIFTLVIRSMERSNLSILTAYGRLFDPGFWISRGLSGNEPRLADKSMDVAETLTSLPWRSQIMDLANRLRMDVYDSAIIKPLERARDLTRQITVAITHHYDAFG